VAEVVEGALGRPCAIAWPWDVGLCAGGAMSHLCRIAVEMDPDQEVAYVSLRLALARLWHAQRATRAAGETPASALFTRDHWREMLLARALHTFDTRLSALTAAHATEHDDARLALEQDWRRRVATPQRVVVVGCDSACVRGLETQLAPDGALLVRQAPHAAPQRYTQDDVVQLWGVGWDAAQPAICPAG
ncbi:MAG TPA: hypothetical protein VHI51_18775, partial [Ktedonobacterales bacterium]|nr:hypothetical protein [Ktedonobacterales bacterium]